MTASAPQVSWRAAAKRGSEPMYAPPSSASAINSAPSMTDSPASKTIQPSDIGGVGPLREPRRALSLLRRAASSLTLKFAVLIAIFLALPFLVYNQFEKSDARLRDLVTAGLRHQSW